MQQSIWEKEYKTGKLVTKHAEPQKEILRFLKYLRKKTDIDITEATALDLGCGTGRNSNYLAELGATVTGYEISHTALSLAETRAPNKQVSYHFQNIGSPYKLKDNSIDVILDVTSSNSLNEAEREVYLNECHRVIKPAGIMFVRALCKDGDKNAKNLLKQCPGPEQDTYIMPDLGITERVFSQEDFRSYYGKKFNILEMKKTTSYSKIDGVSYKRHFIVAYLQKTS